METQPGASKLPNRRQMGKNSRNVQIIKSVLRKQFMENLKKNRNANVDTQRNFNEVLQNVNFMDVEEIRNTNLSQDEVYHIIEQVQNDVYNDKLVLDYEEHDDSYNKYLYNLCTDKQCAICNEDAIVEHVCDQCSQSSHK